MAQDIIDSKAQLTDGPASFWSTLSSGIRKAIIIVLIILLVVLVLKFISPSPFYFSRYKITGNNCRVSKALPERREPRAVSTADGRNMAKLEGYLSLDNKNYLALDINKLTVDRETGVITLEDECVKLSIYYPDRTNSVNAGSMDLEWFLDKSKGAEIYNFLSVSVIRSSYSGECRLKGSFFKDYLPIDKFRYACFDQRAHRCVSLRSPELILRSFEFELDGDPEKIREGQFSKPLYAHAYTNQMIN